MKTNYTEILNRQSKEITGVEKFREVLEDPESWSETTILDIVTRAMEEVENSKQEEIKVLLKFILEQERDIATLKDQLKTEMDITNSVSSDLERLLNSPQENGKEKTFIFKHTISDSGEYEEIPMTLEKVEGVMNAYIHTIMFNDTGFMAFNGGGAIVNNDYFKKIYNNKLSSNRPQVSEQRTPFYCHDELVNNAAENWENEPCSQQCHLCKAEESTTPNNKEEQPKEELYTMAQMMEFAKEFYKARVNMQKIQSGETSTTPPQSEKEDIK